MSLPYSFGTKSCDDYHVAWLCSTDKDFEIAKELLDRRHDPLIFESADWIEYVLGSIGNHNVIIARVAFGRENTFSARSAASKLKKRYPKIMATLLVGTGGGMDPNVKLGDVVFGVQSKDKTFGQGQGYHGMFEWAHLRDLINDGGKITESWAVEFLSEKVLVLAAMSLMADDEMACSAIQKSLDDLAARRPALVPQPSQRALHCPKNSNEQGEAIAALTRERIYLGQIASGENENQDLQIQDLQLREEVNRKRGGKVLCAEIGDVGEVMKLLPCLVIRGISDFADGWSNDAWKVYAASRAAVYAKKLLCKLPQPNQDAREIAELRAELWRERDRVRELERQLARNATQVTGHGAAKRSFGETTMGYSWEGQHAEEEDSQDEGHRRVKRHFRGITMGRESGPSREG